MLNRNSSFANGTHPYARANHPAHPLGSMSLKTRGERAKIQRGEGDALYEAMREINLAYLVLAQRMVHEDREWAAYRLGLDTSVLALIDQLSPTQIINVASSDMFLFRPRCEGTVIFDLLSQPAAQLGGMKALQAALLSAQQLVASANRPAI